MSTYFSDPPPPKHRDLRRLTRKRFDVLIIGGGINGAGMARDLAMRGLEVALVEKGDFASGTSSASTKLIHGGLRYLEQFALHLVFESCRERRVLQTIAPHLVQPMPFLIPVYRDDTRSLLTIRAGLTLYDLLALFRNTGNHRILSPAEALDRAPALRAEGLTGAALYWDCRMDDARLCLENILAAVEAGAEAANYVEATGLVKRNGRTCGARLNDLERKEEFEIEARAVINATGPWLDRICALDGQTETKLRPTRGSHIIVPRLDHGDQALYLSTGRDQRLFFTIPWGRFSLIGTTDVDYSGNPDAVEATAEDIDYLLQETARHLQQPALSTDRVIASFAGLRPLVAAPAAATSRISREHRIFESASGLFSIGGGKYTTYRAVAEEASSMVCERLGQKRVSSRTATTPLPGGATGELSAFIEQQIPSLQARCDLPVETLKHLLLRYGSRTGHLVSLLQKNPELTSPVVPGSALLAVQVAYAADFEMARTPDDVLRRRTSLALESGQGKDEQSSVADLLEKHT